MTAFDTYRRTLTSRDDTDTAWWYLGTSTVEVDGSPEIIVNHVETVMIYRAATLGPASYRVPWWEIGVFRDAITGEVPTAWVNPVTGGAIEPARVFEEGPSGFSVRAAGDDGVEIFDAVQAFAALESAEVTVRDAGDRVVVTQIERKTRSFPGKDGLRDLSAGGGSKAFTILQWFADRDALAGDAPSVPATGMYSLAIDTPAWLGFGDRPSRFMVKGLMVKADLAPPLNPRGWADLQRLFPHYFENGAIRPRWA